MPEVPDDGAAPGDDVPPNGESRGGEARDDGPEGDEADESAPAGGPDGSGDPAADDDGNVFGPRPDEPRADILPGDPELENVVFVVLGVAVSLLLVADLVGFV